MGKAAPAAAPAEQDPAIPQLKGQVKQIEVHMEAQLGSLRDLIKEERITVKAELNAKIELKANSEKLDAAIAKLERSEEKHSATLHKTIQAEIEAAFGRLQGKASEDMAAMHADLNRATQELEEKSEAQVDELMRGIEGSHNLLTGQMQEAAVASHQEMLELGEKRKAVVDEQFNILNTALQDDLVRASEAREGLKKEIVDVSARLEQTKSQMQKADMDLAAACEAQFKKLEDTLREEHTVNLRGETFRTDDLIEALETRIQPSFETIAQTAWILDNMYTRSVTWQIRGFRKKLSDLLSQKERVLHSPPFSVCAQQEMRLDLLAAPEQEPSVSDSPLPPLPTAGSATVRLWAPPGLHIGFRLVLGEGAGAITKRFEHTFQVGEIMDAEGRSSFQMKNLCQLDQIWTKRSNTVNVQFEVLEMNKADPPTMSLELKAAIEEAAAREPGERPKPFHMLEDKDKDEKLEASVVILETVQEDEMFSARCLTSDMLVQERVEAQLLSLKNRTVRRIEWRLEGCTRLLEVLKPGEAVESPQFSAGGMDRVQFMFYPRGCETGPKTSEHGQACAVYVKGPTKTTLRGILSVGTNSRQFEQHYARRGDVGGRGAFCKLENQMDMQDSCTVALEIVEVETDLPNMDAKLVFREAKAGASPGPASPSGGGTSHVGGGAKGSVRMKREDPSKTEEVVRCLSLPALNTQKQFLPKVTGVGGNGPSGERPKRSR